MPARVVTPDRRSLLQAFKPLSYQFWIDNEADKIQPPTRHPHQQMIYEWMAQHGEVTAITSCFFFNTEYSWRPLLHHFGLPYINTRQQGRCWRPAVLNNGSLNNPRYEQPSLELVDHAIELMLTIEPTVFQIRTAKREDVGFFQLQGRAREQRERELIQPSDWQRYDIRDTPVSKWSLNHNHPDLPMTPIENSDLPPVPEAIKQKREKRAKQKAIKQQIKSIEPVEPEVIETETPKLRIVDVSAMHQDEPLEPIETMSPVTPIDAPEDEETQETLDDLLKQLRGEE